MARTGENIYKRGDGRWEARFIISRDPCGKPKYKSLYGKTYGEVKEKRAQALLEALTVQKEQAMREGLLETVAKDWLAHIRDSVKESTDARYSALLERHIMAMQ